MSKGVPRYGFKVQLDHEFPEKWSQKIRPRYNQLINFIPLAIRYILHSLYFWWQGRRPVMEHGSNGKQMYGVPCGGIGSGTIGRGFRGEFCRYQLRPGSYCHETIYGNQFIAVIRNLCGKVIFHKVLSSTKPPNTILKEWDWGFEGNKATYCGLYPRAWTVFNIPEHQLRLQCRQISPVIPKNYKDSCIPGTVFVWTVVNYGVEDKLVSIIFTFQNGIGEKEDKKGGCWSQKFSNKYLNFPIYGMAIHDKLDNMDCCIGISAEETPSVRVTCLKTWNPLGNGLKIWKLMSDGSFPPCDHTPCGPTERGSLLGIAVCSETKVRGQSEKDLTFALVWDIPKIHFANKKKYHWKYYTRFFGKMDNVPTLNYYCHQHFSNWEMEIDNWQNPILNDPELPDWYKSALFNETYFISDGGTVWLEINDAEKENIPPDDPRLEYGRFAYLEGHEYRMYNTYDVHFYASFALAMLWPKLQASLQRDFCDTVTQENTKRQWQLYDGKFVQRKVKGTLPHDLGDPYEDPFGEINAYPVHDVSKWRDLNVKFVLQSFRDYNLTGDLQQLKYLWKNILVLMETTIQFDVDNDGLIENQNSPDQTYDTWTMSGSSSYCGSLWLAALQCTCQISILMSDLENFRFYKSILQSAITAFDKKLWNGMYYNFDCSSQLSKRTTVMSDQLCGVWYLKACDLKNKIVVPSNVVKALQTIFKNNVMKFENGEMGAVNGMFPSGKVNRHTIQSEEVWVGVVYGLASLMIFHGMVKEAFITAKGIYETVYNKIGMGFETPEALHAEKKYRAIGYMRPLSIWSMQLAWERTKRKKGKPQPCLHT